MTNVVLVLSALGAALGFGVWLGLRTERARHAAANQAAWQKFVDNLRHPPPRPKLPNMADRPR